MGGKERIKKQQEDVRNYVPEVKHDVVVEVKEAPKPIKFVHPIIERYQKRTAFIDSEKEILILLNEINQLKIELKGLHESNSNVLKMVTELQDKVDKLEKRGTSILDDGYMKLSELDFKEKL